jgi:hypothetical protein
VWGELNGTDGLIRTYQQELYLSSYNGSLEYTHTSCNISSLLFDLFRTGTDFADIFAVQYLNNKKEDSFTYTFEVGNWESLAYAQFGSGAVTYAVAQVRSIYQIKRDGMWFFGKQSYYEKQIEFSTWAHLLGMPSTMIYDPVECKTIIETLADRSTLGFNFRRNIIYKSTTFIGDGVNIIRNVGLIGDKTFTLKNSDGDFSCDGPSNSSCSLLNMRYLSSAEQCAVLQELFTSCTSNSPGNPWIANCILFEVSKNFFVYSIINSIILL